MMLHFNIIFLKLKKVTANFNGLDERSSRTSRPGRTDGDRSRRWMSLLIGNKASPREIDPVKEEGCLNMDVIS